MILYAVAADALAGAGAIRARAELEVLVLVIAFHWLFLSDGYEAALRHVTIR